MPFQKGQSGNPTGRPKGSRNKGSAEWEAISMALLGEHTERFNQELRELEGEAFCNMYLRILPFFKPKLKALEVQVEKDVDRRPPPPFFGINNPKAKEWIAFMGEDSPEVMAWLEKAKAYELPEI